jgi:undecaprenyl-diphosphatase
MISYLQAVLLGLLQGVSELFPISSLGHSVIVPRLLGWSIDQGSDFFLSFLVGMHLATALVLLGFFWRDWLQIAAGLWRSLQAREIKASDTEARLGWRLVFGTIPAGLLGLAFQTSLQTLFASPGAAAFFLVLNGVLLFGAEWLRRRTTRVRFEGLHGDSEIAQLSWGQAIAVGVLQALALIPGFSRTGAAIAGGLLVGLSHESAARYSFLLATPIIAAAAVLKLPELALSGNLSSIGPLLVGAACAAVGAFLSVRFLTRYFRTNTLTPFALYCVAAGLLSSLALLGR